MLDRLLVFLCASFLLAPSIVMAAFVNSVSVSIRATPEYQEPGRLITLSAIVAGSQNTYTYVWEADGDVVSEGIGTNTVSISSGEAGEKTAVTVRIVDSTGATRGEAEYVIQPGSVDLLWEGQTSTPPFYEGKTHPNGESLITLEAIPHLYKSGVRIPGETLVYIWEVDGKRLTQKSGYGKRVVQIPPTQFRTTTTVRVTAETVDGSYAAQSAAVIPIVEPLLVVYEKEPLAGITFNRAALNGTSLEEEEMTLQAFPFYFSNPRALSFSWQLNGVPFTLDTKTPAVAVFRKTAEGSGTFTVSVAAAKKGSIFEAANRSLTVSFE